MFEVHTAQSCVCVSALLHIILPLNRKRVQRWMNYSLVDRVYFKGFFFVLLFFIYNFRVVYKFIDFYFECFCLCTCAVQCSDFQTSDKPFIEQNDSDTLNTLHILYSIPISLRIARGYLCSMCGVIFSIGFFFIRGHPSYSFLFAAFLPFTCTIYSHCNFDMIIIMTLLPQWSTIHFTCRVIQYVVYSRGRERKTATNNKHLASHDLCRNIALALALTPKSMCPQTILVYQVGK